MGSSYPRFRILVAVAALLAGIASQSLHAAPAKSYAIVVSKDTLAQAEWQAVVDALKARHVGAAVVTHAGDVSAARGALSALMPDYVCFVARPAEAGRMFVVQVSRLMRELDDDPYGDAIWGILTGYAPADALRIARTSKPLRVTRGGSGAGDGPVSGLDNAFASYESSPRKFWVRKDGNAVEEKVSPDPTVRLAECLNTMAPQAFFTSGHATEKDWQVGYNIRAGQFRCKAGQLYAINSKGKRVDIHSPTTKVYVPMGNCLIGHIAQRDCMALAWMRTGGVNQMFGYTAVTFFGYMGWGTMGYFRGGRYSLAEAFFLNNQALIRDLREKHPDKADIRLETYDHRAIRALAMRHKLNRDSLGLLWDRDVVAFYGDPAWQAHMAVADPAWKHEIVAGPEGEVTLTVTGLTDGAAWPKHGILAFSPVRLSDIRVTRGADLKPLVTDNFVLVRPAGKTKKGEMIVVAYKGKPIARRAAGSAPARPMR